MDNCEAKKVRLFRLNYDVRPAFACAVSLVDSLDLRGVECAVEDFDFIDEALKNPIGIYGIAAYKQRV